MTPEEVTAALAELRDWSHGWLTSGAVNAASPTGALVVIDVLSSEIERLRTRLYAALTTRPTTEETPR